MMFLILATRGLESHTRSFRNLEDARDYADFLEVNGWTLTIEIERLNGVPQ